MSRSRTGAGSLLATLLALAIGLTCSAGAATTAKSKHWSGKGSKTLGTVVIARTSVVKWTSTGKLFSLTDKAKKIKKVSGKARSGQSFIAKGTYRVVRVIAKGRWTLTVTPLPLPKGPAPTTP
jgi:hypothetical protein